MDTARRNHWIALLIIVAAGTATYWRALDAPFIFDDLFGIRDNPNVLSLWPLSQAMTAPQDTPSFGRPVVAFSLAVNHAINGLSPRGYHIFNLFVHVLNGCLVYALLCMTLRDLRPPLAVMITLMWLLHPVQTECIAYASQRTELLFGMCLFLTLIAFARNRYIWAAIACAAGMATKETMAAVPLLVLFYDRTFISGTFKKAWQDHKRAHLGIMSTWLVVVYLVVVYPRVNSAGFHHGPTTGITAWTYLLTQANIIVHYGVQTVWPSRLSIDPHFPVATTLADAMPAGLIIVAILAWFCWLLKRHPRAGFVGAWFFLLLAPTSSFVPLVTELAAERRMYTPLLGLAAGLALMLKQYWNVRTAVGVCAFLSLAAGIGSFQRLAAYSSEVTLYEDAVDKFPDSRRAHRNLASWYFEHGRYDLAIDQYELAMAIKPTPSLERDLAVTLSRSGQPGKSIVHFQRVIAHDPRDVSTLNGYAVALARLQQFDQAATILQRTIAIDDANHKAYDTLALIAAAQGHLVEAERHRRKLVELQPNSTDAHNELGIILARLDRLKEAAKLFEAALALDPSHQRAGDNLQHARKILADQP